MGGKPILRQGAIDALKNARDSKVTAIAQLESLRRKHLDTFEYYAELVEMHTTRLENARAQLHDIGIALGEIL